MPQFDDIKTVLVNGKKVAYLDSGKGTPLILIHSWPTCCKIFLQAIPSLSKNFRCIAPDLPGFGMSEELEVTHTYETISSWLNQFLKELELDHVVLFGVSYGAAVAIEFTSRYPKRVDLLILNSPELYYYNQLNWSRKIFYFVIDKFPFIKKMIFHLLINESDWIFMIIWGHRLQNSRFVNSIKSYGKNLQYRAADQTLHNFIYSDSRNLLKNMKTKTVVFTGQKERLEYLHEYFTLSKKNPNVYYEYVEGVGHSVVVEHPKIFAATIIKAISN